MEFVVDGHNLKVLFQFELDGKNYLAYINENDEISASILSKEDDDKFNLEAITDDEEWEKVQKAIEERL